MKKKRTLKTGAKVFLSLLFVLIAAGVFFFLHTLDQQPEPVIPENREKQACKPEIEFYVEPTPTPEPEPELPEYALTAERIEELRQKVRDDLEINSDIKGILVFQNGLLEQPVLQGNDNDHYLYVDWETQAYRSWGSIAMDYECVFPEPEQNTTIYGHYVYPVRTPDRTVMFTPLSRLMNEEEYEDNKYLAFVMEDSIRYYEVASVVNVPLLGDGYLPDDMMYSLNNFSESYFETYMRRVKDREYYHTDIELKYEDTLLTLQTCIEHYPDNREIVLCREIERIDFEQE